SLLRRGAAGNEDRKTHARRRPASRRHQGGADRRGVRRRLHAARLQAGGRLTRQLSAPVRRLRARRRTLLEARMPGQGAPEDPGRAVDVLLPGLSALIFSHTAVMEQAMPYETIIVETKGRVGIVQLNRPQALNALNARVIEELSAALDGFESDDGIGCVVITGSNKAFAAGADIKEMQSKTYMSAFKEDFISKWYRVSNARKPIVAAVAGFALGGGCELAMMCDIIIA